MSQACAGSWGEWTEEPTTFALDWMPNGDYLTRWHGSGLNTYGTQLTRFQQQSNLWSTVATGLANGVQFSSEVGTVQSVRAFEVSREPAH